MTPFLSHEDRLAAGRACLNAALQYLAYGFAVTWCCDPDHIGVGWKHGKQCTSPGKTPMHPWKALQTHAPTAAEVTQRWRDFGYGNVGAVLGQVSGVIRVDIDGSEGEKLLQDWSQADIPPTWEFQSSGTGRGLLYAWPKDLPCHTTATRSTTAAHRELRLMGNGSQTVLPPSRHPSGAVYAWTSGHGPGELPLATAPPWVITRLEVKPAAPRAAGPQMTDRTADYDRVMQAVSYIPSDDYDTWLRVGMALHSTGQPWAREVWDTWSQHSTKYDATKQEQTWGSFDEDRTKKATLGTLFYLAQQAGWCSSGRAIPDMAQPRTACPQTYHDRMLARVAGLTPLDTSPPPAALSYADRIRTRIRSFV